VIENLSRAMLSQCLTILVLEGKFDGKKRRGRPRMTWSDDVIGYMQKKKNMTKLRDWLRKGTLGGTLGER